MVFIEHHGSLKIQRKKKLFHWPFNRLSHIFCRLNESKDAKSVFHSVSESANERKKKDEKKSNCNRCNSDHSFLDNIITNYTIRCQYQNKFSFHFYTYPHHYIFIRLYQRSVAVRCDAGLFFFALISFLICSCKN